MRALGTVTRFRYDQRNRVVERLVDPASRSENLIKLFVFDALDQQQIQVTEKWRWNSSRRERITTYIPLRPQGPDEKRVVLDAVASGLLRLCTS